MAGSVKSREINLEWGWDNLDEPFNPEGLEVFAFPHSYFEVKTVQENEELPFFVRDFDIHDFLEGYQLGHARIGHPSTQGYLIFTRDSTPAQKEFLINRVYLDDAETYYLEGVSKLFTAAELAKLLMRKDVHPKNRMFLLGEFLENHLDETGNSEFEKLADKLQFGVEKIAAELFARGIDVEKTNRVVESYVGRKPDAQNAITTALDSINPGALGPDWESYEPIFAAVKEISPTPQTDLLVARRMAELVPTRNESAANIKNITEIEKIINALDENAQKYFYDEMLKKIDLSKIANVAHDSEKYSRFAISLYVRREKENAITLFSEDDLRKIFAHMWAPEVPHTFKGLVDPELIGESMVNALVESYRKRSDLYSNLFSNSDYELRDPQDVIEFRDKVALAFAKSYITRSYIDLDPSEENTSHKFVRGRQGVTRFLDEWGDSYFGVRTEHNAAIADMLDENATREERVRLATLGCLTDERSEKILFEAAVSYTDDPNSGSVVANYAHISVKPGMPEVFNGYKALQSRQAQAALLEQAPVAIDGV